MTVPYDPYKNCIKKGWFCGHGDPGVLVSELLSGKDGGETPYWYGGVNVRGALQEQQDQADDHANGGEHGEQASP